MHELFLTEREALEEMQRLRGKLPSGSALQALQNYDDLEEDLGKCMGQSHVDGDAAQLRNNSFNTIFFTCSPNLANVIGTRSTVWCPNLVHCGH
jgi:chromatin remodeling complex protein RSC6